MSIDDEREGSGGYGGTGQTRTRLPDAGGGDVYGGARRGGRSSSRGLVTVVGVVVLLIAAIAFANRGGDDSSTADTSGGSKPDSSSTAASGTKPVTGRAGAIATGYAHDQQGAQSAAANYAVALGSADMSDKTKRDAVLATVIAPAKLAEFEKELDTAYSPAFNKSVGLNDNGSTPQGFTFVSRTSPIGTKVTASTSDTATVEVWCSGLLGLAGQNSTNPVTNSWFTNTVQLQWAGGDWKIVTQSQKAGPAPVPGDDKASSADEMANAVQEYGGFTYAR